jgi:hypothetical protein
LSAPVLSRCECPSALQSIRYSSSNRVLPRRVSLFGLAARSESLASHSIAESVKRSHFAVSHFVGCVVFLSEAWLTTVKLPVQYSLELCLRLEISEPYLASGPQPASASHGLSLPTAHPRSEDPLFAGTPARSGPPSGFGYPLDGLRPSDPRRFCFTPAALLGFALRSFLLSDGIRGITTRKYPLAVSPAGFPIA